VASQPQDWIVEVDTGEDTQTFLASLVGIPTVPIVAEAQAGCGTATALCNIWPISFHEDRWAPDPYNPGPGQVGCDDIFFVWNDNFLEEDCYTTDPVTGACVPFCEACLCDEMVIDGTPITEGPPDDLALNISPEHRGWLNLPRPEEPYDAPSCADNCGAAQITCWIDQPEGYTGEIPIDPAIAGGPLCLPGEPGVSETVRHHIEDRPGMKINILIWNNDYPCYADIVAGTCPGDWYHIRSAGCIEIDPYNPTPNIDIPANPDYFSQPWCVQNVKVVKARRDCVCSSECGSTVGPPVPGGVNSVSLIK
jgi:hypothetical protein